MTTYPDQVNRLLKYLDQLEEADRDGSQHVALRLETKLVRGNDTAPVRFRWTDDPNAPAVVVREEDLLKNYPLTYRTLTDSLKRRYSNFVENDDYHSARKKIQEDKKYSIERLLNPSNPKSCGTRFFSPNILQEFDKIYQRRKKPGPSSEMKARTA